MARTRSKWGHLARTIAQKRFTSFGSAGDGLSAKTVLAMWNSEFRGIKKGLKMAF